MSGTRKRRGTTLVELSLVIAILAMVALPFVAFVSQNLKNTVLSSTQLKEQMVLEQVMQDMEKHLRSAVRTPPMDDPPSAGKIVFTSREPQPDPQPASNPPLQPAVVSTHPYTYELRSDGLFYKNAVVFPDGLEANLITGLKFPTWNLDPTHPPCYITIRIEAKDTALQRTIYLRNYTSTVSIPKILGVMVPRTGEYPVPTITPTTQYTGTVTWTPALPEGEPFKNATVYTARIALALIGDYTLTGVAERFFTVAGTTGPATNDAGSGVVTAVFPATAAAQLTITATGPTKVYGTALTAGTSATNFTAIGAIAGETVTSVTLTPDAAGLSATTAAGAAYVVTPSLATGTGGFLASNYTITYVAYNGTVGQKALTVTATAGQSKIYGAADPTFAYTFAPALVGSDVMSGALSRATGENVGTYAITQGMLTAGTNYTITFVSSTFSVTAKSITAIGVITDDKFKIGSVLTAGALTPSGATVTYQWQRANSASGPYTDISGATSSTYTPVTPADKNMFIRVVATGTGNYSGTVTSAATEKINP